LSPNVSLEVDENKYGPRTLDVISNGVIIVYFSFIFALDYTYDEKCKCEKRLGSQILGLVKIH
jgi:hypothetical protein